MPLVAKRAGATLVEINPEDTPLTPIYDTTVRETAIDALTTLCEGL
jgi:NAD-dependent SIR2 family protein deacetylase